MPWHGDLRAGTGDFLTGEQEVLTGEQKLNGKGVSRLCGLNAEHSSLCGKIIKEGVSKTLPLCFLCESLSYLSRFTPSRADADAYMKAGGTG